MWIFPSLINSFMSCIIDHSCVCQSTIKFSTYTFPCVMSSLTIRLAYNLFHLFPFFLLKHESKRIKTQTNLYYAVCRFYSLSSKFIQCSIFSYTKWSHTFRSNFYCLFAPITTYLRDLAHSLGRYGGHLKIRFGFKGFWMHK